MKDFILGISLGICISIFVSTLTINFSQNTKEEIKTEITKSLEEAYFEGQRDVLNGDVRLAWNDSTSHWQWTKSPWNSGQKPLLDLNKFGKE